MCHLRTKACHVFGVAPDCTPQIFQLLFLLTEVPLQFADFFIEPSIGCGNLFPDFTDRSSHSNKPIFEGKKSCRILVCCLCLADIDQNSPQLLPDRLNSTLKVGYSASQFRDLALHAVCPLVQGRDYPEAIGVDSLDVFSLVMEIKLQLL